MGTKLEELQRAGKVPPEGCLGKAKNDEPIFVLRAQDKLAPALVHMWIELARLHNCNDAKLKEAEKLHDDMLRWQGRHKAKYPD